MTADGVTVRDLLVEDPSGSADSVPVRARLYSPASPTHALVWLHGGAMAWGDLDMPEADATSRWFAERHYAVLSVDYRLAPEPDLEAGRIGTGGHPFPAPHHDTIAAFRWMGEHAESLGLSRDAVALGGASAGGTLSSGAAVALRDQGGTVPSALVLVYPVMHAGTPEPSDEARAALAKVPRENAFPPGAREVLNLNYVGGDASLLTDPRVYPGEGDVAGLPRTIVVNSEFDDLRPSGEQFVRQLEQAGVEALLVTEPDTFHGHLDHPDAPHAERTLTTVLNWLANAEHA